MNEIAPVQDQRKYDLEDRTLDFAKNVRSFVKKIPLTIYNTDDIKQLIRSSGSVGANYREANDNLGQKDFLMRIRISKKEAKESIYWLTIIECDSKLEIQKSALLQEAKELMYIFGSIIKNAQSKIKPS